MSLTDKLKNTYKKHSREIKFGLAGVLIAAGGITFMPACCNQFPTFTEIIFPISQEELINQKYERILAHKGRVMIDFFNTAGREAISGQDNQTIPEDVMQKVESSQQIEELLLSLARKSITENTEIKYDDAYEIAKQIETIQKQTFFKYTFIDITNENLTEARANWVISNAKHYGILMTSPLRRLPEDPTEVYSQMIQTGYKTREAYLNRLESHIKTEEALYNALTDSTFILLRPFAKPITDDLIRKITERYRNSIDNYFPLEENQE